jgi:ketosteroid isomerase-like protein
MAPPSSPPPASLLDHEAVIAANARFYAAFEAMDYDAMIRVWSEREDVSCIHPGWHLVAGREQVLASWAGIFRGTERIRFAVREPQAFVLGDTAWIVLVEEIEAEQREGIVRALAQTTNVFVREGGAFRLVHHHAAPMPVAEEEAAPDPQRVLH